MNAIAAAFIAACRDELEAPKPGNVHVFADGHRMTATDFVRSAEAAARPLAEPGTRIGQRVLGAVEVTRAVTGQNTNLGIILLCAPLAAAAEKRLHDLRIALSAVLDNLDVEDATLAFRAIVLASPAGLGRSEDHDVYEQPSVTLRAAMAAAEARDRIAYQFSHQFTDILDRGLDEYAATLCRWSDPKWAALAVYLNFLAAFPDTHIVRKHGARIAEEVQRAALPVLERLQNCRGPDLLLPDLLTWDAALKRRGINPGTSADLTVATLFAYRLQGILPEAHNSG